VREARREELVADAELAALPRDIRPNRDLARGSAPSGARRFAASVVVLATGALLLLAAGGLALRQAGLLGPAVKLVGGWCAVSLVGGAAWAIGCEIRKRRAYRGWRRAPAPACEPARAWGPRVAPEPE
jgi:hypothetical protein